MSLPTVLLVAPDDPSLQTRSRLLIEHDLRAVHAEDHAMALGLIGDVLPELILMDRVLPGEEPLTLLKAIRHGEEFSEIPIIVISNDDTPALAEEALEAGADGYLCSPVRDANLIATIRGVLRLANERDLQRRGVIEYKTLIDINLLLAAEGEPEKILAPVAARIAALVPLSTCSIVIISPDWKQGLVATEAADFWSKEGAEDLVIDIDSIPELKQAVDSGQPLVQDNVVYDPLEITLSQDDDTSEEGYGRSFALFPAVHEGDVHGVVILHLPNIASKLSEHDLRFLTKASEVCGPRLAAMRYSPLFRMAWADDSPGHPSSSTFDDTVEEQKLLVNLVEHSADAIVAADMSGIIMVFNRSAEQLFGYASLEVIGQFDVSNVYLPGGAQEMMRILRSKDLGEPGYVHNLQTEVLARDGQIIPVSLSAAILYEGDEEIATVGMFQDLRQRLALESRLQEMAAQLVESEKQAAVAALAGTAAHELNQPLTTIMGLVEMLQFACEDNEQLSGQLDRVYAETERMSAIVRRIGKITKFTTTRYVGDTEILDLEKASE